MDPEEKLNNKPENIKYVYWLDDAYLLQLKEQVKDKGKEMLKAEKAPCEALRGEIGYAKPQVWTVLCKYDAAPWYYVSKHTEKNLVVSSFFLSEEYSQFLQTTIEPSLFQPKCLPSNEELIELSRDPFYLSSVPKDFLRFPKEIEQNFLKVVGEMTGESFEKLEDYICTRTAVHSNFLNPKYRAGKEFMDAPYSVAIHVGACCVELFNLLDSKESAMLVKPCTGSIQLQVLKKDYHYLVHIIK